MRTTMVLSLLVFGLSLGQYAQAADPATGAAATSAPARKPYGLAVPCFAPGAVAGWKAESGTADVGTAFSLRQEEGHDLLRIATAPLTPGVSTVLTMLPGEAAENGDLWARNRASYISFLCKSSRPVQMTFHLLIHGKTPGTYQAGFTAAPGEWQRVILPLTSFGLKSFAKVAGIGFRVAEAEEQAEVSVTELAAGAMPFSDDTWKSRRVTIDLQGEWRFAADPGAQGMAEKWYAAPFEDGSWKTVKTGLSWQQQGFDHAGWGWYRRKITVPATCAGMPLTLSLGKIASDDEVWFNGVRVGGLSGEYKYENWLVRSYTVPAALIRSGAENTIALRIWGGNITFIGDKSGLFTGPWTAAYDPYRVQMREPGGVAVPAELFDLSDARQGKPFEMLFSFPAELVQAGGAKLRYRLGDFLGNTIQSGQVPLVAGANGIAQAVAAVDRASAQTIYLRGRLRVTLIAEDAAGSPLYAGLRDLPQLSFAKRDLTPLPALQETTAETPYGKLKLVDEIDCATSLFDDPHPYIQSGFSHAQDRMTPGAPLDVTVTNILGRPARTCGCGWFAYRIGRGQLKPHTPYLVRIEYPEDQPRYCPIELQVGQTYMDVGWKNGVAADDIYDPWPLSHAWQWYDVIVPLDHKTVGTGGTGSASIENGFWIYFMNKVTPGRYYTMWSAGPAVARIRLYEIDAEKNVPVIQRPQGLPNRVLCFDWERQADCDPADLVRYGKLMGYSAIAPVIIKWASANYSDPLSGYTSVVIDDRDYWAHKDWDPVSGQAVSPLPGRKSQHVRFIEATKRYGIDYIPRFEWGGSLALSKDTWATDVNGQPAKPDRFNTWCVNILNPLAWDDLKSLMDHLIKPYVKDNPQLTGALWRQREDRVPISYGKADLALFSKETATPLPAGGEAQQAAWAATEMKVKYDDWWHQKRATFHIKLADLLKSYRSDLTLYYYNWDGDKFGLIEPSITTWAFVKNVVKPAPEGGRAAYVKERELRKTFTAADYISVLHSGNFGKASGGINRADYGLRPELYKVAHGIQLFGPVNALCYAEKPDYINYFRTADGLAVSDADSYDEVGSRSINPKFEGSNLIPAGAPFSMTLELLSYFHGDARTLTYTAYTFGRGFADAHRRFAQAFLALPAIPGTVVDQGDPDLKVRIYPSANGTYVGVAYKGYAGKRLAITLAGVWPRGAAVRNLVTNEAVPATVSEHEAKFDLVHGPMELNAFLIR